MTKVISISAFKGGGGKTTTAVATGVELARRGNKVLIIDMDPQSDVATALGEEVTDDMVTTEKAIAQSVPGWPAYPTGIANLKYTPSSFLLENVCENIMYTSTPDLTDRFKMKIGNITGYDYIIIDCPPRLDKLTRAALFASDYVVVPAYPGPMHLKSIKTTLDFVEAIAEKRRKLKVAGILFANAPQFNLNKEVIASVRQAFPGLVFDTIIRSTILMAEAPLRGMARAALAKNLAAADYVDFTTELLARIQNSSNNENKQ